MEVLLLFYESSMTVTIADCLQLQGPLGVSSDGIRLQHMVQT